MIPLSLKTCFLFRQRGPRKQFIFSMGIFRPVVSVELEAIGPRSGHGAEAGGWAGRWPEASSHEHGHCSSGSQKGEKTKVAVLSGFVFSQRTKISY